MIYPQDTLSIEVSDGCTDLGCDLFLSRFPISDKTIGSLEPEDLDDDTMLNR